MRGLIGCLGGTRRWEVLTCLLPWGNCSPWQVVINVTERGNRPEVPPDDELLGAPLECAAKACYVALMKRCWAADPAERPAFSEIACALRCASHVFLALGTPWNRQM